MLRSPSNSFGGAGFSLGPWEDEVVAVLLTRDADRTGVGVRVSGSGTECGSGRGAGSGVGFRVAGSAGSGLPGRIGVGVEVLDEEGGGYTRDDAKWEFGLCFLGSSASINDNITLFWSEISLNCLSKFSNRSGESIFQFSQRVIGIARGAGFRLSGAGFRYRLRGESKSAVRATLLSHNDLSGDSLVIIIIT